MIAIGADHGGFDLKEKLKEYYNGKLDFKDFGTFSTESVNYPEFGLKVAQSVSNGECECGIVICRTGVGMSIVANKVKNVRCALCYNKEVGKLCKEHNNANVIALPADMISLEDAIEIIEAWLSSEFQGGRHEQRLNMFKDL